MEIFIPKNGILISINNPDKALLQKIIESTKKLDYVVGYRISSLPVLKNGLDNIKEIIRDRNSKPVIYDHQKFGSDIVDNCTCEMLDAIKSCGFDGIIILPLSGKNALESIVNKCNSIQLLPVVCGDLPYNGYFSGEGGYIEQETQQHIYLKAANLGISHFVMSCNRIERIKIYCHQMDAIVGQMKIFFTAINSIECNGLPDVCKHLEQNKAYAVFELEYEFETDYLANLENFWNNFRKKIGLS